MIRGDIVTVAARCVYSGKPRPALILQADEFADLDSVVVYLIWTTEVDAPIARIDIEPSALISLDFKELYMGLHGRPANSLSTSQQRAAPTCSV